MTVPFIPTKDFEKTIEFYKALGFEAEEVQSGETRTCYVYYEDNALILQEYYVKDWAENTMLTIHVSDLEAFISNLQDVLNVYPEAKFNGPKDFGWGNQIHLLDTTGVLIHVFQKK